MRYMYDQNEIQIRCLNGTIILFTRNTLEFYEAISPLMHQA